MKTQNELAEQLTTEQLKACALKQFHGEDFFLIEIGDEVKAFEGTEEEAKESYAMDYLQYHLTGEGNEDEPMPFEEWVTENNIEVPEYDEDDYNLDYICLTDDEATEKAGEYIKDSLWAFNAEFLASETGLPYEIFEAIAENGKCESNNDTIEACIKDMDGFIESAISADGRGHFLNTYDGEENEESIGGQTFYIYRIN